MQEQKQSAPGSNNDLQGNDKDPQQEQGHGEEVSKEDLTGKKVDADPAEENNKQDDKS